MQTTHTSSSPARKVVAALLALTTLVLCGCDKSRAASAATAPSAPPVGVTAAVARDVRDVDEFTGRLEATESVAVRPRVGGYIEKVHFRAGQEVKKGELLISIDPMTYRAEVARFQGELVAARSRAGLARLEKTRGETLFGQKAISQQENDQLTAALETNTAAVQAAQAALQTASLNLGYTEIRAPISGRVSRALVTEGNLVAAGSTVLATIESQDQMYAYFDVSESTFLRFSGQSKGPLRSSASEPAAIEMGLLNEAGYPHAGRIESFDNRLNVGTGAIRTRAVFDNARREFTPGLYARMRFVSGAVTKAVLIPERAIGTDQSKKFAMVVGADDVASYRNIQLGSLFDGMRVVTEGLEPGERVIVDGLQRVRPGAKVAPELEQLDEQGKVVAKVASAASAASSAKR